MAASTTWDKIQTLQPDTLRQLWKFYSEYFPVEIRSSCAAWIENNVRSLSKVPQSEQPTASGIFLFGLVSEVKRLMAGSDFVTRIKLEQALSRFDDMYGRDPVRLAGIALTMLDLENKLLNIMETPEAAKSPLPNQMAKSHPLTTSTTMAALPVTGIAEGIIRLGRELQHCKSDMDVIQLEQESYSIFLQDKVALEERIKEQMGAVIDQRLLAMKKRFDTELVVKTDRITAIRKRLAERLLDLIQQATGLMDDLQLKHIIPWKRERRLSSNGFKSIDNLQQIQERSQELAQALSGLHQLVLRFDSLCPQVSLEDTSPFSSGSLAMKVNQLFCVLARMTLIVDSQPPQLVRLGARFGCSARLLAGSHLADRLSAPVVEATLIRYLPSMTTNIIGSFSVLLRSEAEVKGLINGDAERLSGSGLLVNNKAVMVPGPRGELSVAFRSLVCKSVRRNGLNQQAPGEDVHYILLQTQLPLANGSCINIWVLSDPVAITLKASEETRAMGALAWRASFSQPELNIMEPNFSASWSEVADLLSSTFHRETGLSLLEGHLLSLAEKLLGQEAHMRQEVTRLRFYEEPLPDRDFTFWEWFYSAVRLVREHLRDLWAAGCIHGFVSRETSHTWLMSRAPGTFLLRFSDSVLGCLTITWLAAEGDRREILSIQPFGSKDLLARSCADRIRDLADTLTHLYPDIPRDDAFGQFYSRPENSGSKGRNDYVAANLHAHFDGKTPRKSSPLDPSGAAWDSMIVDEILGLRSDPKWSAGSEGGSPSGSDDLDQIIAELTVTPFNESETTACPDFSVYFQ